MDRLIRLAPAEDAVEWFRLLADLSFAWLETDATESVLEIALSRLEPVLGLDISLAYQIDRDGEMRSIHAYGVPFSLANEVRSVDAVSRTAAVRQQPATAADVVATTPLASLLAHHGYVAYPVISGGSVFATLGIGRKTHAFSEGELVLLEIVANHASIAVERAELRQRQALTLAELRRNAAFNHRLLERLPGSSVAVVDRDMVYQACTASGFHSTDLAPSEIVNRPVGAVHDINTATILERGYGAALAGLTITFRVDWNDRHYTITAAPLDRDGDDITTIATIAHDETERFEREAALSRSETRHRLVANAITSAIWECDLLTGVGTCSEQFAALYGHSTDDPSMRSDSVAWWLNLVHPEDRPEVEEVFARALSSDATEWKDEYRFRRGDGSYAWVRDAAVIVREGGRPVRILGATQDVTAEKAALQTLEDGHRRKDRFLATLGHELRQPLGAMASSFELLRLTAPSAEPKAVRARDIISRQFHQLTKLVDDLLDVSRVVTGKLPLSLHDVNVEEVLHGAVDAIRMSAESKQLRVSYELAGRPISIRGDASRLQQVFSNLLNNAVKFTPAGGNISVTAREDLHEVIIEISDTGCGLEKSELERIFEWFVQAEHTVSGLGVGLPLSRAIVAAHDGHLTVTSQGNGQGSTFKVALPKRRAASALVMIVDDDDGLRELMTGLLRRHNMVVLSASNGADATAQLEAAPDVDLFIVDVEMPLMSGPTFVRKLRDHARYRETPVLMISGALELEQRAREIYVTDTLAKPFTTSALLACVSRLIRSSKPTSLGGV